MAQITAVATNSVNDNMLIGDKRLSYYDNQALVNKAEDNLDENYPIVVKYNSYFETFVVLTKSDVRIYNSITGLLQ